jgi:hypothetical protein
MPYLNWRNAPIRQEVGPHPKREFSLKIGIPAVSFPELVERLEDLFGEDGAELRVDLPEEWILFWKIREEESRLLMAHPQKTEWVATAALEKGHGQSVVSRLKALRPGESLRVSDGGTIGRVSNVEIEIDLLA